MYFPLIDVLRGFAAVSVLVYHVVEHFHWAAFPSSGPLVWFRIGWIGVDLFFVISGLVVSLSAFRLIDRLAVSGFRWPFVARRLARIVPLYYLTGLVFVVFIVPHFFFQANFWPHALAHMLFVHNLDLTTSSSINGVNWSIGVEMQFYAIVLVLAPVLRSCRWWLIPAVAMPVAWAWRWAMVALVPVDPAAGPAALFWASTQLPGMADEFAFGILLCRLLRSDWQASLRGGAWMPSSVAVGAAGLVWATLSLFWLHSSFWDSAFMVVLWRSLCGASCAAVVLAACLVQAAWIVRALAPLRYLGTISYGIYLWHLPVISSFEHLTWLTGERALPVVLGVTVVLAAGSWSLFERPAVRRTEVT